MACTRVSRFTRRIAAGVAVGVGIASAAAAGPLDPPAGPIGSTGKTLTDVEPRIAISATTTPGDSDSTFRIIQPGSYYLTGNVTGEATKKGIEVLVAGGARVTIDLNGFTMAGTGSTSTQAAIYIDGASANVVVRNGAIRNWNNAVNHFIGGSCAVEDVHASGSSGSQFLLKNAVVSRCVAQSGGGSGFVIDGGTLSDCAAVSNQANGFTFGSGSAMLRECSARSNGSAGFSLGGTAVAENCHAESNTGHGFSNPLTMTNCASIANGGDGVSAATVGVIRGCNISGNTGDGIQVSSGSRIEGNTLSNNFSHGINVVGSRTTVVNNSLSTNARLAGVFAGIFVSGADNSIDSNHITNMLVGGDDFGVQVTGTSNLIVRNTLSAVSTYFSIAASNFSGGSATNPATATAWANITY